MLESLVVNTVLGRTMICGLIELTSIDFKQELLPNNRRGLLSPRSTHKHVSVPSFSSSIVNLIVWFILLGPLFDMSRNLMLSYNLNSRAIAETFKKGDVDRVSYVFKLG